MGVFPFEDADDFDVDGLPHARGGVSSQFIYGAPTVRSSPRPWGCFYDKEDIGHKEKVFPTPVGVFLLLK